MKNNTKTFMSKTLTALVAVTLMSTAVLTAPVKAAEQVIVNSTFENGTDGWTSMGNCNVQKAGWVKNSGNNSLYIGNRQQSWNGASLNLNGKVQAGATYNASVYFMSWQINNDIQVKMTLSYKDNSGNTKYSTVASATAGCGQWKEMNGSFTVPNDANNVQIYFETSDRNGDIYIDDVKITKTSGGSQQQPSWPSQPTQPTNPSTQTGSMVDIANAYMKNMKIDVDCPSSISSRRGNVQYGSFQHKTYYSSTTRSNRGYNILLPVNYNPQKKYPVLYVLHGVMGDENSMKGNGIEYILGNHVADGNAKEMIVVLPNMFCGANGQQPTLDQKGMLGYDNFINDLKNDLMPHIQKNYSVATGRENTAIAGFSLGGRETLFIGITTSNLFGYVGAICPAPGVTPGRDYIMNHPGQLQESQLKIQDPAVTPYVLMIAAGTNDQVVGTFPKSYHNILTRNGQNHIYYEVPGGGHDNRSIASGLNNFIRGIFHAK